MFTRLRSRTRWPASVYLLAMLIWLPLAAQALTLPDRPVLTPGGGVKPNVIVTLDNSDVSIKGSSASGSDARRFHFSAHYNKLYYDPTQRYTPPPGYGHVAFSSACRYFDQGCTVNLGSGYFGTHEYSPSGWSSGMWHPSCDSNGQNEANNCTADNRCTGLTCIFGSRLSSSAPAYYYHRNPALPGCGGGLMDEDCYEHVLVGSARDLEISGFASADAAKQNFANWYSYYRTAQMTYISAMLRAFPALEGKVRLAWQGHGQPHEHAQTCAGFGGEIAGQPDWHRSCEIPSRGTYDNRLADFDGAHKTAFYRWLVDIPYAPQPPNTARAAMVRAAEYFMRDNAYRDDPRNTSSPMRSCRANYHIMFNGDGYSNNDQEVSGRDVASRVSGYPCSGRAMDVCTSLPGPPASSLMPSPSGWLPRWPYRLRVGDNTKISWYDGGTGSSDDYTLASLALHYWATDLKPGLSNDVQPYLPAKTGSFDDQFWNPRNDPATWQHMVNLVVVHMSTELFGADWDGNMFSGLPARTDKNWPRVYAGSSTEKPGKQYDFWRAALNSRGLFLPADDVDAMVNALTATLDEILTRAASATTLASSIATTESIAGTHIYKASFRSSDWSGELAAYALDAAGNPAASPEWTASLPTTGRKVLFWNGSTGAALSYAALSAAQRAAFDDAAGSLGPGDIMNWILGDRSKESPAGPLRSRDRLLGDIVNSDPVFVGDEVYPALFRLPGDEGRSYHAFRAQKKDRVKMVYVGANDGMVHGFVAGAGKDGNLCGASLGQEVFAYVPGAVVEGLPHLAKPDYTHRFYADGPLFAGDAYLDLGDGDKWRTILVGGLGNGGRAVFALDVTAPCAFDAGKVLWEFQHADLGYTHARPLVARLNNGKWAAIVANGYNSALRHAVLFLIDLKTGALIKAIDADTAAGMLDNGLMSPTLYDADNNGTVDYVYAGDNLGRLWKFDLSSTDPNAWGVAFGGQPLFSTGGEPFQAPPRLGDPPPGQDGVMIYIGSGRLVTEGDKTDTATRALYGILDKGVGELGLSHLVAQTPNTTPETIAGRTVRKGSQNAVDYATQFGWRLILPAGERILAGAQMVGGRILFPSLATSSDPCDIGGEGWMYELDPFTGGMPNSSIFILGTAPAQLMALKLKGASKSAIFLRDYGTHTGVMLSGDLLGQTDATGFRLSGGRFGRVSWREIID